jgi:hypothetical protein
MKAIKNLYKKTGALVFFEIAYILLLEGLLLSKLVISPDPCQIFPPIIPEPLFSYFILGLFFIGVLWSAISIVIGLILKFVVKSKNTGRKKSHLIKRGIIGLIIILLFYILYNYQLGFIGICLQHFGGIPQLTN